MVFENGVKNIQAAAYNGARMVLLSFEYQPPLMPEGEKLWGCQL